MSILDKRKGLIQIAEYLLIGISLIMAIMIMKVIICSEGGIREKGIVIYVLITLCAISGSLKLEQIRESRGEKKVFYKK